MDHLNWILKTDFVLERENKKENKCVHVMDYVKWILSSITGNKYISGLDNQVKIFFILI